MRAREDGEGYSRRIDVSLVQDDLSIATFSPWISCPASDALVSKSGRGRGVIRLFAVPSIGEDANGYLLRSQPMTATSHGEGGEPTLGHMQSRKNKSLRRNLWKVEVRMSPGPGSDL